MTSTNPEMISIRLANGESIESIASSLGVSVRRVYQILGPAKEKPRVDETRAEEVRRRAKLGHSQRQIAEDLGMSRKSVASILGPVAEPNRPFSAEEIESIRKRHAAGHEPSTISHEMQRSLGGVKEVIARLEQEDWIRDLVIERAAALKMDAMAISEATGERVSAQHVAAYLAKEKTMSSWLLQHVFRVLNLRVI